ncbi:HNH endonuclease [Streptomyces sp. NPDC002688]|uniref:HNH endonuclease n=1 Tax=Streptomyces sp. NPDC002688 TaxID=3154423 RepID=UPI00332ADE1B
MTPDLRLVYGCPKWCAEDHSVQQGADRECHSGPGWAVRLPDGTPMMEARLVHEAGEKFPQLAVFGPGLDALKVEDVTLLGADEAAALEADLQRFLHRIQKAARVLQGNRPPRKKPCKPGFRARAAWREMRLYLAERDGRQCFHCRTPFDSLKSVTIDHYVPKSLWACNLPANLVLACQPCNGRKSDRLTWSMAAVLLAWHRGQAGAPDRHTVTVTPGTVGREAPAAGQRPLPAPSVAAC